MALATGCAGRQAAGAQSNPQSLAQYDIARDLWLNQSQPREALGHALEAAELGPEDPEVRHLLALLYLDLCSRRTEDCRLEEAERQARTALELSPDFREARNTLGVVLIHAGRPSEAVSALEPLTRDMLYRTPEVAWGNLGWAYLELNQPAEALAALQRSTSAQPEFCVGHYRSGLANERLDQWQEAADAYTRALDSAEGRCRGLQSAYAGRARALAHLGRDEAARRDLEACAALSKQTPDGRACAAALARSTPGSP